MLKKINYVLDKRQKINLIILLFIIFVGAFVELLGVSMILPVIELALDPTIIEQKWYLLWIKENLNIKSAGDMLVILAAALILVYIIKNFYITFMYNQQYKFIFDNQRRLAVKLMDCYMHQKYLFHVSKNVAELQRNVTSDVNGFYTVVLYVMQLLAEVSVCVVLVVYLMFNDVLTTLIVAALLGIFTLFFSLFYKKILGKKGEENRRLNVEVSKWILQAFSGIKEIKVINAEKYFLDNYDKSYRKYAVIQKQQSMLTFISRPLMETICISALLLTVIVKLKINDTNLSDFIPTLSIFAVAAFRMLPSFNRLTGYLGGIMFNKASIHAVYEDLKEIEELLKNKENVNYNDKGIELKEAIHLKEVSFKYPETDRWILNKVNLSIKNNTSVAFIGASGAGKTTAADVILGLLEPQKGEVLVDDTSISGCMAAWHSCIGYIPQTIYLMDDTIRANIAFGVPGEKIDEKAMQKALKEAKLDEFVSSLKDGLDTVIGDRGVRLSGGQRQRIGIARALYRNPRVLVLDEATSALDNETEKEVMQAIDGLQGTRTLIVIAHRLSTIKKCDVIYEVGDGKILEKPKKDIFGNIRN